MIRHGPTEPTQGDPTTMIALIYRIVDEPRRALTFISILLPLLAVVVQVSTPRTMVAGVPAPAIWWGGTAAWEIGWHTTLRLLRRKSGGSPPSAAREDPSQGEVTGKVLAARKSERSRVPDRKHQLSLPQASRHPPHRTPR